MVDHVKPDTSHPALHDASKWSFLGQTKVTNDWRLENKPDNKSKNVNLAMTVNHAPLGHMLRHRARHQQLKQPGQRNVDVASIYPLDRDTRFAKGGG